MASNSATGTVFELGDWLVDVQSRQLRDLHNPDSTPRTIEPKTMAVLAFLASRPGEVVSMDDIVEHVWGDNPVSDNPVYKCIAKLRKILDAGDKSSRYIETIPKTGYRLLFEPLPIDTDKHEETARRKVLIWVSLCATFLIVAVSGYIWRSNETATHYEISHQKHLSTFPGSHKSPDFSPDGSHIVYVSNRDGVDHLWVMSVDHSDPKQLTFSDQFDTRPRWSPVSEEILFNRSGGIWSVSRTGGNPQLIIADGTNPNWSADGKEFVFERQGEIWRASADGNKQIKVEGVPTLDLELAPRTPAISPNGQSIAFFRASVGPLGDIWTIPVDGGIPKQITFDNAIGGAPVWTTDSKALFYSSQRGGNKTLWRVSTDGGKPVPVLLGPGAASFPALSASGKHVAYSHVQQRYILVMTDLDTGEETELTESSLFIGGPTFSNDDSRIAFFKMVARGFADIFTIQRDGSDMTVVTRDGDSINAIPQWSADDKWIYFYQVVPGMSFRKVPSEGGTSNVVVDDWNWNLEHGAHVDASQKNIVYSRLSRGVPVTTRIRSIETGKENVFGALLDRPRWSADTEHVIGGKFESANNPEGNGVLLCDVNKQQCRRLSQWGLKPQWSADESSIYFVRAYPGGQSLWAVDRHEEAAAKKIADMTPISPIGNFYDISADNQLIWVRLEQSDSEIWLAEFEN